MRTCVICGALAAIVRLTGRNDLSGPFCHTHRNYSDDGTYLPDSQYPTVEKRTT